jgi:hypothetical protein
MAFDIYNVITTDLLKKTVLVGIDLTDDNGDAYPDELFDAAIKQSVAVIENELEIVINKFRTRGERHDAIAQSRRSWWSMALDRRPLKKVDKLAISYGNYPQTDVPLEWVNITSEVGGSVSLIPTAAVLGAFNFSNSIPLLVDPISNFSYHDRVPAYFKFDYESGFNFIEGTITVPQGTTELLDIAINEKLVDKPNFIFTVTDDGNGNQAGAVPPTVQAFDIGDDTFSIEIGTAGAQGDVVISYKLHTVPDSLIKAILYMAAMLPLDTAGDLIVGAGIAAFRLGVDGLSQEINTTSSATNSGYGARMLSYRRQLKTAVEGLRKKYTTTKIGIF